MVLGQKKNRNQSFYLNNTSLEIFKLYKYLGTLFTQSGNFLLNRKVLVQQAPKSMFLPVLKNK